MISIKMTGLIDMLMLKKWNEAVEARDKLWRKYSRNGILYYDSLAAGLRKYAKKELTDNEIRSYLKDIHGYSG